MSLLLWALTAFNLLAGAASLGQALRLAGADERRFWRSATLYRLMLAIAWSFPAIAFGAVIWAWAQFNSGGLYALPLILAPIAWLIVMGIVFTIADYAEDGVIGNARARDVD